MNHKNPGDMILYLQASRNMTIDEIAIGTGLHRNTLYAGINGKQLSRVSEKKIELFFEKMTDM